MKSILFSGLILLSFTALALPNWLVRVESEYKDIHTQQMVKMTGWGVALSVRELQTQYYPANQHLSSPIVIATAAHVGSGKNLKVSLNGNPLRIYSHYTEVIDDVQIIYPQPNTELKTLGEFNINGVFPKIDIHTQDFSGLRFQENVGSLLSIRAKNSSLRFHADGLVSSKAPAGTSGSPLFFRDSQGLPHFLGLIARGSRFFNEAEFIAPSTLVSALATFLTGKTGVSSYGSIRMYKGATFKTLFAFPDTVEINTDHPDIGNATIVDRGETGHLATPINDPWSELGIQPGMIYKGNSIIGFELVRKCSGAPQQSRFLYANMSNLRMIDRLVWNFETCRLSKSAIPSGSPILDILGARAPQKNRIDWKPKWIFKNWQKLPKNESIESSLVYYRPDVLDVSFRIHKNGKIAHHQLFRLDQDGKHWKQKEFRPILNSNSNPLWKFDIRGLFFHSTEATLQAIELLSSPQRMVEIAPLQSIPTFWSRKIPKLANGAQSTLHRSIFWGTHGYPILKISNGEDEYQILFDIPKSAQKKTPLKRLFSK